MFSNLIIYSIQPSDSLDLNLIDAAMADASFAPCAPSQEQSTGWVPARGVPHGPYIESIAGHWLAKFQCETKSVPSKVLERKVDEVAREFEQKLGRKPTRKERRELKEDTLTALLPNAFAKQSANFVWLDASRMLLCIDSANQTRADMISTALVEAVPGLSLQLLNTPSPVDVRMSEWLLTGEPPPNFDIGRECELVSRDEAKAVVRYARHPLDIDEVGEHIRGGKSPTKVAMSWTDRVSFTLTDGMALKKIQFLEAALQNEPKDAEAFDCNAAIATGELTALIQDLLRALQASDIVQPNSD
jgi:recombination associated protein RdgC